MGAARGGVRVAVALAVAARVVGSLVVVGRVEAATAVVLAARMDPGPMEVEATAAGSQAAAGVRPKAVGRLAVTTAKAMAVGAAMVA